MSQDVVADALNTIRNCKKAGKAIVITKFSKFLIQVLDIANKHGYLNYKLDEKNKTLSVEIKNMNECRVIKPRFTFTVEELEKYVRRYLPARDFGILIVSTSSGLMTHKEAYDKKIGGSLIAYFY